MALLDDLKALSERDGEREAFGNRIDQLRLEHARKPSFLDRLDRAGFIAGAADTLPM
ncbi:hypothetical protein AB0H83_41345 [Dactylosporangium sp. NPDC050688]|uniref:hypothetical protein n=1 Tax=Dactylosporangium sp. NPDC050688 TaxID=3157217 RepID=UPI0033ED7942